MLFGVVNSSATFQGYINSVLHDYLNLFCIAYLNNILIYLENVKSHTKNVRKVLEYLLKHGLFIKLEKYVFSVLELSFLGFIFTTKGVKIDLGRVATTEKWPLPRSFRDI